MKHLDLFSGIGGFALAARRVGWDTIGFCEIDPYCRKVLSKHWPGVPIHDDITSLSATTTGPADIITGGFPCQDISVAGKGIGIAGSRSGLWTHLARLISEVRPAYAVVENVSALLHRGMDDVLGDLAKIGYDCEWHCIPAASIGAPHRRDRVWIIAYPDRIGCGHQRQRHAAVPVAGRIHQAIKDSGPGWWATEPALGRVAHGVPRRMDRLRGLGNAIVPAVAQVIFGAINDRLLEPMP